MKQVKKSEIQNSVQIKWIFYSAFITTLYFEVQSQDPFNSPKFWTLILFAAVLIGYIFTSKINLTAQNSKFLRILVTLCIFYIAIMLVSSFFSYSWQVAIFGDSFRRNGVFTYIGFVTFFIASALFVRFENVFVALKIIFLAGVCTGLYSLIQITGHDWVKWSVTDQIISTFGNTNFSGAGMSIFAIVVFGLMIINFKNKVLFFIYTSTFTVLIYAVLQTNARQALIMLALGLSIFMSLFLYRRNKKIWRLSLIFMTFMIFLTTLALFKIGPLESFIYKSSISVREFYWRAGFEMFKHNPILGIGPDHYGTFFKEYRDPGYPLAYGWGITSSNAHNVLIQNFATGGIFLGFIYLSLQILVGHRALKLIKHTVGAQQVVAVLLFSAWIAYEAQSLVSIEFIGVSIWGWIIGGALVGLSFQNEVIQASNRRHSVELNFPRLIVTFVMVLLSLLIINPLRQVEKSAWRLSIQVDANNQQQLEIFNASANQVLKNKFTNTDYKNLTVVNLLRLGEKDRALQILIDSEYKDPRNLDTLALLVDLYEKSGDYKTAIFYRNRIAQYDPWNAQNYLGLAQLYKVTNDSKKMSLMVDKILSFASSDPIAEVAKKEFTQNSN